MNPRTDKIKSSVIVYDADLIEQAGPQLFERKYWEQNKSLVGEAQGRGSALLLETSFGPAVLRKYLRGGWVAKFNRDRYLYTGLDRTRPMAEFRMLAWLQTQSLPAPHPLAALCVRNGFYYSASLLMRRILNAVPLGDLVETGNHDKQVWQAIGKCIRKFHEKGVVHADLNARNILVRSSGEVFLIDFDQSRVSHRAKRAFDGNLKRLRRSLEKFWPEGEAGRLESSWSSLLAAYAERARH